MFFFLVFFFLFDLVWNFCISKDIKRLLVVHQSDSGRSRQAHRSPENLGDTKANCNECYSKKNHLLVRVRVRLGLS